LSELVYPRERTLGAITLVLGVLVWLGLIVGTFGVALLVLAVGFVLYLFAQSALIAHIKGNGVELSEAQFPDLHSQFVGCCEQLGMKDRPRAYVLNGNGGLNAFATKFLGAQFVVLMSDVVDAMDKHADGVRFYIGHELGHLRMKHLQGHLLRWPVLWLPLLGAAYSRARESTCDRHGLACSSSPDGAVQALAALSAGPARWEKIDVGAYLKQARESSGFWMSFHELTAGYPWLTKRAARVAGSNSPGSNANTPARHPLAYLFAVFVPYAGRLGAGFGFVITIYIVGVLAAVALPAYQDYTVRARMAQAYSASEGARTALGRYYEQHQAVPESLEQAGVPSQLPGQLSLQLDAEHMVLNVVTPHGGLVFSPGTDDAGHVTWRCEAGEGLPAKQVPPACRGDAEPARR
jgi:Zn-dependent protease with chaperone function/type II secretory pathway pseudopilin PulG